MLPIWCNRNSSQLGMSRLGRKNSCKYDRYLICLSNMCRESVWLRTSLVYVKHICILYGWHYLSCEVWIYTKKDTGHQSIRSNNLGHEYFDISEVPGYFATEYQAYWLGVTITIVPHPLPSNVSTHGQYIPRKCTVCALSFTIASLSPIIRRMSQRCRSSHEGHGAKWTK